MSLLLDALKKAAEQKAENNGETVAEQGSSDDTVLSDQTLTKMAPESQDDYQHESSDSSQYDFSDTQVKLSDTKLELSDTELELSDTEVKYSDTKLEFSDTEFENDEDDKPVIVADESISGSFNEDETLLLTDDDVTAFLGDDTLLRGETGADTELRQIDSDSETDATNAQSHDLVDEELSISLFDEDDSPTTGEIELELAPLTDITKGPTLTNVPSQDEGEVEIGRSDKIDEANSTHSELSMQTASEISTRTFAPDNYDRTLRKAGSEDVSNVFAGVKSDTDIVMTPEYAKKMFRSKSSAQRIHNVKYYAGTALAILVVIAVVGVLELEQDTKDIDNNLRNLKRDPMPGLIKNKSADETFTNLFAATPGSEVDATTLELVKNAETQVDTEEVVAIGLGIDEEISIDESSEEQTGPKTSVAAEAETKPVAKKPAATKIDTRVASVNENDSATSDSIKIISTSKITEKDQLLREAYAAYQRGDDKAALVKYNAALDLDPGNRNALLARAAIHIQNNRIGDAIRDYQTLLIANPKDSLAMSSMIAIANYSPQQSETQLKLMIRDEPNSPYLNFALGNIFGAQNRWHEAQGQYFVALENNPGDPNYAYNLAVSLEHISRPKVAIAYYEKALSNYNNGLATFNRDIVDA